jgi:hypothetical protein
VSRVKIPRFDLGGRRKISAVTLALRGLFDELFLFLHIAQPQTKCDGPRTLHRLIRCLFAQIFVLEKRALTRWRRDCCMPMHDETRRYSLLSKPYFDLLTTFTHSLTRSQTHSFVVCCFLHSLDLFSSAVHQSIRSSRLSATNSITEGHDFFF